MIYRYNYYFKYKRKLLSGNCCMTSCRVLNLKLGIPNFSSNFQRNKVHKSKYI